MRKPFACMDTLLNNKGFSLIATLTTMSILLITLPLITYLIRSTDYSTTYQNSSAQLFFHLLQEDLILATDYSIKNNEISIHLANDDQASIKKFGRLIHRQVKGKGHEVYIRDVDEFKVNPLPYGFHVEILLEGDNHYEKTIVFYE